MPQPANVTSIEALDTFKATLRVYLERAGRILDAVGEEVVRTRVWLQTERLVHWKNQVRQRGRELAQAEQELLTARLSGMPEAIKARRMAVNQSRLALGEAEAGLTRVKQWIRQYETQVESHAKVIMQLRHSLSSDMTKAVTFLDRTASTLAAYAEVAPPSPPPSASSTGPVAADTAPPQRSSTEPNCEPEPSGAGGAPAETEEGQRTLGRPIPFSAPERDGA